MDAQRALLDELMGTARDLTEEERKGHREAKWDDPDVCGPFMARFCPHDLFVNTKSNLGPCLKIHDPRLKESFESSPRHDAYLRRFEAELAQQCEKLVTDLDRKIRRGRDRLAQDTAVPPPIPGKTSERLAVIEENVKKLLEQIEELGEACKVAEAEALMRKVDLLNAEKAALTNQADHKMLMLQEKKMELCEICGSFLVSDDVLERTQSHLTGKQHIGYGLVRDFLAEYKAAKEKAKEEERLAREKKSEERRKQREKEYSNEGREGRTKREKSGERDYDRDHYYERSREREKPHDHRERGSDYRGSSYRNGRDSERDRHRYRSDDATKGRGRMRSRSRSPSRHGYGRSNSPDLLEPYSLPFRGEKKFSGAQRAFQQLMP
ncbi:luc7-like protein 3 isoform X2 [Brachypodium distachyon]|uniref:luc7-like protein 3 isoform X2 n=1 Tax=Brachypodium distachyon TaxID=15368 RepID=UPI000D0D6990|nr:luc7-like protein 3 isoform X2 [Brachypodium distachyon]|eukprot:XP_024313017.1 luc7-like protein 3 isoform X2 [Brachypodium distachyon]